MGLYPQPNDFSCGPFALKHALVMLGRMASETEIAQIAKTHWWSGTDELGLARAARAYQCDFDHARALSQAKAKKLLIAELRGRTPVMLCVDGWAHWITAVRYEADRFVVIDSNLDPVMASMSWTQLERRWRYLDTDYDDSEPPRVYDYLALRPRFRVSAKADFSLARLKHLRRSENQGLARHWDDYLGDLLEICRPRSKRLTRAISFGELLRRHQDSLIARVVYWHGDVDRERIARLLANLRFVAETYGLVVPASTTRQALLDLSVLATMAAATVGGLPDEFYELTE